MPLKNHSTGFTLAELAIVLAIVMILLTGLLVPLSTQIDQRRYSDTQRVLDEVKEALIGYAMTTPGKSYLPCPNTDGTGTETSNRASATTCTAYEGWIPWATLGVGQRDSWGNRFRYRVHPGFIDQTNGFTLATSLSTSASNPEINVYSSAPSTPCGTATAPPASSKLASQVPVVILSHGKNGLGSTNDAGIANASATSPDELKNMNNAVGTLNNACFVSHTLSETTGTEFDDLVTWIPASVLRARMVAAGRLP